MKVKKGDNIIVITGKDKGRKGKVIKAIPNLSKVVVEGINMKKRHQRPKKSNEKGQVLEIASPIDVSNIKLWKK
ncbi:50S ribosomal protein L24 [Candidatus Nomurabacteria bacterium RIFCSPLOWO2_01_FULL_33_24]|uniref:Large ribosomal subunit protein uL24 n=1 Tax=Candidatus Nomurabacteria bacterium RIFCSPLOWO2_01_FULL_33_24 TaxID=1801765 RepID=A0A1F6X203_9BACT|nr:MAG: 50S ribosomal protein L24 [Candidatus Nomurabacteria bacterium RIFCSPLOWO2_01_FULL_33_24]